MSRLIVMVGILVLSAGCAKAPAPVALGNPELAPVSEAVGPPPPPRPDVTRLRYDALTRTLTLYPLPEPDGRWHIVLGDRPSVPVDGNYELTPEAAALPDGVRVYYALPGRAPSPMVTVQDIAEANSAHAAR